MTLHLATKREFENWYYSPAGPGGKRNTASYDRPPSGGGGSGGGSLLFWAIVIGIIIASL